MGSKSETLDCGSSYSESITRHSPMEKVTSPLVEEWKKLNSKEKRIFTFLLVYDYLKVRKQIIEKLFPTIKMDKNWLDKPRAEALLDIIDDRDFQDMVGLTGHVIESQ